MRVGTSLASGFVTSDHREAAQWMIDRARAAADADLDLLSLGDHHATGPLAYYQNVPMLGRLLAEWNTSPAGCLFLLPLWHPVLAAEAIGTLAAIHPGQFVVQTGIGGGEQQFAAMGRSLRTRGADIDESIRIIDALLTGDTVSSERFGITDAAIAPRPNKPVEWWMGGTAPAALQRAARVSGIFYAGPSGIDKATDSARDFVAACERVGRDPSKMIMRQDVVVAPTDAQAEALAAPALEAGYRGMGRGDVAVGSPETVAELFATFGRVGYVEIAARQMPIPQESALESIHLLGRVRDMLGR